MTQNIADLPELAKYLAMPIYLFKDDFQAKRPFGAPLVATLTITFSDN